MTKVKLLHNPAAGDEGHGKDELLSLIGSLGFDCRYASIKKKDWKEFENDLNFVIVAGGDGTIKKIAKQLLKRKVLEKTFPIALLPLGTANNIGKTLGITGDKEGIIASWKNAQVKNYDIGRIYNIEEAPFFLESFGYGVFPYLMQEIKNADKNLLDTPEKKKQTALELLHKIILAYEPKQCKLELDGTDHSGKFILAEIMNIKSIGPNLILSPEGDVGDGKFEVVIVDESDKEKFASYVLNKINGREEPYSFNTIKAKEVKISWDGTHVHADDKIIKLAKSVEVTISIQQGLLEFLVPQKHL